MLYVPHFRIIIRNIDLLRQYRPNTTFEWIPEHDPKVLVLRQCSPLRPLFLRQGPPQTPQVFRIPFTSYGPRESTLLDSSLEILKAKLLPLTFIAPNFQL